MADNAYRLERIIRREKVSVVHVRSRAPAFSALAAARRTRTPLVATYHGLYAAASPLKRWYNGVMTRGDVVIANSAFTRDHILSEHHIRADRIELIPEGVDTSIFDPAEINPDRVAAVRASWGGAQGDGRAVILVAARLTGWKGHRVAIEALARSASRERARLVFVGRGEKNSYAAALSAAAADAGVALTIAGPCADMAAVFLTADVVAAPSTEPETFGRSVAEAGAMARIVVASDLGGTAETVVDGQTGLLAPAGDIGAWAAAFDRALNLSPDERAIMGIAAWTRVREHYSMTRMCQATFALYSRLSEAR
jgi:glycosyltransferase involved in cell wall biosynthesis